MLFIFFPLERKYLKLKKTTIETAIFFAQISFKSAFYRGCKGKYFKRYYSNFLFDFFMLFVNRIRQL